MGLCFCLDLGSVKKYWVLQLVGNFILYQYRKDIFLTVNLSAHFEES
jgi:hypothetical protein